MITYFCTDSHGNTYTRQSKHSEASYFFASIQRRAGTTEPVSKGMVSYSSRRDLADKQTSKSHYHSEYYHCDFVAETVAVRAYPGRHKVEPKTQAEEAAFAASLAVLDRLLDEKGDRAADAEAIFGAVEAVEPPAATDAAPEPTKALYGELQVAYDHFNAELFKGRLPHCLMTLKCKPNSRGHYAHARFVAIGGPAKTDEIAMNPISLGQRPLKDSLSTLVHEMVHLEQQHFGTPGKGSHHNREWGVWMKRQGLWPSSTGLPGGKETGNKVSHYVIEGGPFDCAADALLATGFKLSWADAGAYDAKKPTKQGKRVKYSCVECGQSCWAKHDARFICGDCEIPMSEVTG